MLVVIVNIQSGFFVVVPTASQPLKRLLYPRRVVFPNLASRNLLAVVVGLTRSELGPNLSAFEPERHREIMVNQDRVPMLFVNENIALVPSRIRRNQVGDEAY